MIIQLFRKYGTISKIDFLWHTSGPKKGLPRGYCFVEFSSDEVRDTTIFVQLEHAVTQTKRQQTMPEERWMASNSWEGP